ncbi:MAG: hypothetical protein LC660_14540 [Desulfobacteraceae bacterium]|nr:hypothetical protein [Desulfobacteraceae bacterium]
MIHSLKGRYDLEEGYNTAAARSIRSVTEDTPIALVDQQARGYTILVFARSKKKHNQCTVPFVFLGPATHVSHQKERPIQMSGLNRRQSG